MIDYVGSIVMIIGCPLPDGPDQMAGEHCHEKTRIKPGRRRVEIGGPIVCIQHVPGGTPIGSIVGPGDAMPGEIRPCIDLIDVIRFGVVRAIGLAGFRAFRGFDRAVGFPCH